MTTAPEDFTTLSVGGHTAGDGKACLMEYVSLLAGEAWSDNPTCTHPVLANMARNVNDLMGDENRHLLVPLIGRLLGTSETGTDIERKMLSVSLAIHSAKTVLHLVCAAYQAKAAEAIEAAEQWVKDPSKVNANRAKDAVKASLTGDRIHALDAAAHAAVAAYADRATITTSYAGAGAASNALANDVASTTGLTNTTADKDHTLVDSLSSLIDEYDRLTGRTEHREVRTEELNALRQNLASLAS